MDEEIGPSRGRRVEWDARRSGKSHSTNMFMILSAVASLDNPSAKDRRFSVYSTDQRAAFGNLKSVIMSMLPEYHVIVKAMTIEGYLDQTMTGERKIRVKLFESERNVVFSTDTDRFEIEMGSSPCSIEPEPPRLIPTGDLVYHEEPAYMDPNVFREARCLKQMLKDALVDYTPTVDGVD